FGGLDLARERKSRPIRLDEANGYAARRKRGLFGLRHPIEPDQRDAAATRGRAHRADLTLAGSDRGAALRGGRLIAERHRASARDAALLDPRHHLLADIAAFGEIDPAKSIHIGFVGKSVAIGEINSPAPPPERGSGSLIILPT